MSILSSTKTGKSSFLVPCNKRELINMIEKAIIDNGKNCSLNHIDVSNITDMSNLFRFNRARFFDGDISKWNVSNVADMSEMFKDSQFTGINSDISRWDVSNVADMSGMFENSIFNGDIHNWTTDWVYNTNGMFKNCLIPYSKIPKDLIERYSYDYLVGVPGSVRYSEYIKTMID